MPHRFASYDGIFIALDVGCIETIYHNRERFILLHKLLEITPLLGAAGAEDVRVH